MSVHRKESRGFLNGRHCYFVINRGIRSKFVFRAPPDYRFFLRLVRQYKNKFHLKIFGFCILPDSAYLIVQPINTQQLVLYLRLLTQTYTRYFNSKYQNKGRVWKTRYKLFIIRNDADLFESIKFLEFMPVRSLNVDNPIAYPWSSCSHRIQGEDVGILDKRCISPISYPPGSKTTPRFSPEQQIAVQEVGDISFFI